MKKKRKTRNNNIISFSHQHITNTALKKRHEKQEQNDGRKGKTKKNFIFIFLA
jgi:hypothetical protein